MNKYGFNVAWSAEDEGYIATCPEFPGLSAWGTDIDSALREAQAALSLFIKTYVEDGRPLPSPQSVQQYSGQTRLRLPKDLHGQAARIAERKEVSLNQLIVDAVRSYITEDELAANVVKEVRRYLGEIQFAAISVMNLQGARTSYTKDSVEKLSIEPVPAYTAGHGRRGN